VLGFVIARLLFERFPEFSEGRMTRIRADLVSRASCASVALELGLDAQLAVRGEGLVAPDELVRLVRSRNVLAAMLEAAVAAVFLQHGYEAVQAAVVATFAPRLDHALTNPVDYKTELQEALARLRRHVAYVVLDTEGPAHERLFTCAAVIDGEQLGVGSGRSKKDAEQIAAEEALGRLDADGLLVSGS
jgi:ribonuclease-3